MRVHEASLGFGPLFGQKEAISRCHFGLLDFAMCVFHAHFDEHNCQLHPYKPTDLE